MQDSSKRAELTALIAFIFGIIFFVAAQILSRLSDSFAVYALSWQILAGALIWFVLVIHFHQKRLAEQEKLDMSQLTKAQTGETIFRTADQGGATFAIAQQRLKVFEKWFLPIFSIIIAAYQISIGLYMLNNLSAGIDLELQQLLISAVLLAGIAFLTFLFSLYATGMSSQPQWRPLKAGGSYMLATAILCFAIAVAMGFAQFDKLLLLNVLQWLVPIVLVVLGAETGLNLILDIYRPRIKDKYSIVAFESRLLGLICTPGSALQTAAHVIDYQFGFKVSQTWFFKLLAKAVVPLILFSAAVLYSLSCITIVKVGQEAVIERFGSALDENKKARLIGPGLNWKLPWPIDIAYTFDTKQVQEIRVGFVKKDEVDSEDSLVPHSYLWTEAHHEKEYDLLVASETMTPGEEGTVPISIMKAAIPVQYRVKNLYDYRYNHADSRSILEAIAYREVVNFTVSSRIEATGDKASLFGPGRAKAAVELAKRIQAQADDVGLGVEILFVGMQGIHPPQEVAPDYQAVIGAVQRKQAVILIAMAQRNNTLATLAGSVARANELYELAEKLEPGRLTEGENVAQLEAELDKAFASAKGEVFAALAEAKSYAFEKEALAEATGKRFQDQLTAYHGSESIYKQELRLAMLEVALEKTRKYIVASDANDRRVIEIDLQEKLTPSLYDLAPTEKSKLISR